jgi:uncharacterized membrane protein
MLSAIVLFFSGAIGLYNGLRELGYVFTPFQRSVSTGVLLYGVVGMVAGVALVMRHPSSVWLAAAWGVLVTFVASTAALAYAGSDATVIGAVAGGMATGLIAAAVVWSARVSSASRR